MADKRKKVATSHKGVRYREHETRKHGIHKDRQYFIRYAIDGKEIEEGVGWASEGCTAAKAAAIRAEVKRAAKMGEPNVTLAERQKAAAREREREARRSITTSALWADDYEPQARARLKPMSFSAEKRLFKRWIEPRIGSRPLREVDDHAVEAIMDDMRAAGLANRTIEYMLGVVNRLWKLGLRRGIVTEASPTSRVQKPKVVNSRLRALTAHELRGILEFLAERDPDAYDLTLFCALTGCRASEAFGLLWEHVDFGRETAFFPLTKNKDPREVYLAPELAEMLRSRGPGAVGEHVFNGKRKKEKGQVEQKKGPYKEAPKAFRAAVNALKLNEGRGERERVTFHTLRHSAATFAARRGTPVKDLQTIFGWRSPQMVFRYAKPSEDVQRRTMQGLAQALTGDAGKVVPFTKVASNED